MTSIRKDEKWPEREIRIYAWRVTRSRVAQLLEAKGPADEIDQSMLPESGIVFADSVSDVGMNA